MKNWIVRVVILFLMMVAQWVQAEELTLDTQDAVLLGHNVTPAAVTPKKGIWTVGNYAVGVGLTDEIFLATSPWIWVSYNTSNIHLKWIHQSTPKDSWGFFTSYFKSYNSTPLVSEIGGVGPTNPNVGGPGGGGPGGGGGGSSSTTINEMTRYEWESLSFHALYARKWSSSMKTHFNVHYAYFWNDDFPYSIRMDPGDDSIRDQIDVTSLTEFRIGKSRYYYNLEVGGLGLNYLYPYFQLGMSFAYKSPSWLVQLGASSTMQFREMFDASGWSPGRYDNREHYSETAGTTYYLRYLQTALHPEINFQYFF